MVSFSKIPVKPDIPVSKMYISHFQKFQEHSVHVEVEEDDLILLKILEEDPEIVVPDPSMTNWIDFIF